MFVRILHNSFKRPYLIHRFRSITDLGYSATMLAKSNVLIGIYSIKIIILLLLYRAVISFFFFLWARVYHLHMELISRNRSLLPVFCYRLKTFSNI